MRSYFLNCWREGWRERGREGEVKKRNEGVSKGEREGGREGERTYLELVPCGLAEAGDDIHGLGASAEMDLLGT